MIDSKNYERALKRFRCTRSHISESLFGKLIQRIIKTIGIWSLLPLSSFLSRSELATFIQEVIVAWKLSSSAKCEDQLLVPLVLFLGKIVLDKKATELFFEQVISLYLSAQIFTKLFVSEYELLHSSLLLFIVNFLHLSTVEGLFETFNLTTKLLSLLSAVLITNSCLHLRILFANRVSFDLLLIDHPTKCVNYSLKLLNWLDLPVSKLDCITRIRDLFSCNLWRLLLDGS